MKGDRMKNVGRWTVALSGLPLMWVIMPVSCCLRNPAAVVMYDDVHKEKQNGNGKHEGNDTMPPFLENIAAGFFGFFACLGCCGCCFGKCGKYPPKEF